MEERIPFRSDPNSPPNAPEDADVQAKRAAFLNLALDRWQQVDEAESKLRRDMREDLDFFASDQWPADIKSQRNKDGRPCLTVNRLPGFVRQLTNEMRDARPGIEAIPVDNVSDPALAEVCEGLFQHIEHNSDADVAYARAAEDQVRVGRGFFRVVPEYASDTGFEQELRIKSIRNQATVYFDPASQELDGSDARYCLIVDDIPNAEYDAKYGEKSRLSLTQFARVGESFQTWQPEGKTRVAEYYSFIPKTRTIHLMANGMVVADEDLQRLVAEAERLKAQYPQFQAPDLVPRRTRQVEGRQLTWALINGAEILEGNDDRTGGRELPGRWIPVFPVYGEEIDLDGEVDRRGIIRDAKDAQRMMNFWLSAETETVALAPKAPHVAEEGQIENHEEEWRTANVRNYAVLKYKAKSLDGHLLPAPQRQTAEPPIQAMAMLQMQMENSLRAVAGFSYDTGTNEKRLEQSGRAILARQAQGEKGNSHFSAHLAVSIRHCGRVILDLLPYYYDTPRVKRILGRDGRYQQVLIHAGNPEEAARVAAEQGIAEQQIHDLAAGRYDVRVKAGVSYASQRQQDQELVANVVQTNPQMMQTIGDIFFQMLDGPVAERIAKRLAKTLPPGLKDPEPGQPPPIPPDVQLQMQQAQQLVDMLTQRVNELTDERNAKLAELASKERIAEIQAQTDLAIAQSKAMTEQQIALLETKMREIEQLVKIDMARLQAATEAQATAPSPAPAPSAGAAPPSPEPMFAVPAGPPPMGTPEAPPPVG